jgi:hypothetical protein
MFAQKVLKDPPMILVEIANVLEEPKIVPIDALLKKMVLATVRLEHTTKAVTEIVEVPLRFMIAGPMRKAVIVVPIEVVTLVPTVEAVNAALVTKVNL